MSPTMSCAMCLTPGLKQSASGSKLLHRLCDGFLEQSSIRSVSDTQHLDSVPLTASRVEWQLYGCICLDCSLRSTTLVYKGNTGP